MSKEFKRLLETEDKKINSSRNALSKLFRDILAYHDVRPMKWDALVTRYFRSPFSRTPKNAKDIGQDKNNLNRALAKDALTWNNFFKALMILSPKTIEITITMEWPNRNVRSEHKVLIPNPVAELDNIHNEELQEEVLRASQRATRRSAQNAPAAPGSTLKQKIQDQVDRKKNRGK